MITQYNTTSKPNELNKTLTDSSEMVTAKIRTDELDVLRPSFICKTSEIAGNYFYISELEKYYFIESTEKTDNVHTRINLKCDVLMTYKEDILNSYGLVTRGGNINPYYSSIESDSRQIIRRVTFPYTFNNTGNYVLVTITNNSLEG